MLEETMLERRVWAVVGANQNPEKYGNMIYKKLKAKGYEVYAVNPYMMKSRATSAAICRRPQKPDVVNMVAAQSKSLLRKQSWVKYVWFQPGTHDDEGLSWQGGLA